MAQTIANFNHVYAFSQLDTYNYTILDAGTKTIAVKMTDVNPLTNITILIKQNGTTIETAPAANADVQNEINASILANCSSSDVISVVVSSTNAADGGPNQLRGLISITAVG